MDDRADGDRETVIPGELLLRPEPVLLNAGRQAISLEVTNTGDRPIQVGSHFHFFEVNRALRFDRAAAYGLRLDIASGAGVRFEPGETRPVRLIPLAGTREMWGCNGLVEGFLDAPGMRETALARAAGRGFLTVHPQGEES